MTARYTAAGIQDDSFPSRSRRAPTAERFKMLDAAIGRLAQRQAG
ncbi:hypothetical protein ACFXO9_23790 [Nocardia tengchongensis]